MMMTIVKSMRTEFFVQRAFLEKYETEKGKN